MVTFSDSLNESDFSKNRPNECVGDSIEDHFQTFGVRRASQMGKYNLKIVVLFSITKNKKNRFFSHILKSLLLL
jgi:hypothetical protein